MLILLLYSLLRGEFGGLRSGRFVVFCYDWLGWWLFVFCLLVDVFVLIAWLGLIVLYLLVLLVY